MVGDGIGFLCSPLQPPQPKPIWAFDSSAESLQLPKVVVTSVLADVGAQKPEETGRKTANILFLFFFMVFLDGEKTGLPPSHPIPLNAVSLQKKSSDLLQLFIIQGLRLSAKQKHCDRIGSLIVLCCTLFLPFLNPAIPTSLALVQSLCTCS